MKKCGTDGAEAKIRHIFLNSKSYRLPEQSINNRYFKAQGSGSYKDFVLRQEVTVYSVIVAL